MCKVFLRLGLLLTSALAMPGLAAEVTSRTFEFNYEMLAGEFPTSEAVDIYIPLPAEHRNQQILATELSGSLQGEQLREDKYGNRYYHVRRPANVNAPIELSLSWQVRRDTAATAGDTQLSAEDRAKYLAPNALGPVEHPILEPIIAEIHALRSDDSQAATARAIYDWVVDNVEYKKVGQGWGNGDTFWACNKRYGNCTDFHALFISLARSQGIPAKFEMGFPVPTDRPAGTVGGYHCWVQFYLPERGWVAVDASEAAKNPAKRELYYGGQPMDRIHFTTGRDLVLSEVSKTVPLNYFIYPYVEVGGKPWAVKVETRFSYRELDETLTLSGAELAVDAPSAR